MGIIKKLATTNSLTIDKLEQIKNNLKYEKEIKKLEFKQKSDNITPKVKNTLSLFSFLSLFSGKKRQKTKGKKKSFPLIKGALLGYNLIKKALPKKKK